MIDQPSRPISPLYLPSYVSGELLECSHWTEEDAFGSEIYDALSYEHKSRMSKIADKLLTEVASWTKSDNARYRPIGQLLYRLLSEDRTDRPDWDSLSDEDERMMTFWSGEYLALHGFPNVTHSSEEEALPITVSKFEPGDPYDYGHYMGDRS